MDSEAKNDDDDNDLHDIVDDNDLHDIVFTPPVSLQRYNAVIKVLSKYSPPIRKVIDFGCSRCNFLKILKSYPSLEEAAGVDIDLEVLKRNMYTFRPSAFEYIIKRPNPLTMKLFHGNIADFDIRLSGYDAAVGIEIIEHLELPVLESFIQVIFNQLKPRVVIFTTPNADFNVCFKNFSGKRNLDHKFEWTRLEFQTWCKKILTYYSNYCVSYEDIGTGPTGTEIYGACSQMAVFERLSGESPSTNCDQNLKPYHLVCEYEYPFTIENRSKKQQLLDEAAYYLNYFSRNFQDDDSSNDYVNIPLQILIKTPAIQNLCSSVNELRNMLSEEYIITEDDCSVKYFLTTGKDNGYDDIEEMISDQSLTQHSDIIVETKEVWD